MAVPTAILEAARAGDRDRVLAWLDAPDVEETRDVNAVGETLGGRDLTLLMMVASRLDSETSLELARDLVHRGADVNHSSVSENLSVIVVALGSLQNAGIGEFVRDFVILLIENGLEFDGLTASYPLSLFLPAPRPRAGSPHERRRPGRRPSPAPPERVGLENYGVLAM